MRDGLFISTHFIFNCILNFAINLLTKLQAPVAKDTNQLKKELKVKSQN
jgi:hypothetical protein